VVLLFARFVAVLVVLRMGIIHTNAKIARNFSAKQQILFSLNSKEKKKNRLVNL
jgi:hypothetical protein